MEVRLIENKELLESAELFKIENLFSYLMGNRKDCKNVWIYWIRSGRRIIYQTCVCGEESSPNL